MNREEVIKQMHKGLEEVCDIPLGTAVFDDSTTLRELKLDSLRVVELQMFYEEETGQIIPDTIDPIVTMGDLINLILKSK